MMLRARLYQTVKILLIAGITSTAVFAQSGGDDDFEKEFYNEYLDSLPDDWADSEATLRENLERSFRRVLQREDPLASEAFLANFRSQDLQFKRVDPSSPFVRGIFKEAAYLKQTKHMYIVKTGPYLVFLSYRADPRRFIMSEYQNKLIKKRPPEKEPDGHKEDPEN